MSANLLPKQIMFLERALKEQIQGYENKITSESVGEDELSDMQNDLILMKPTLEDLQSVLKNL